MTAPAPQPAAISTPLRLTGILIAVFVAVLLISFAASYLVIRNSFDAKLRQQVQGRMADYLALADAGERRERLVEDSAVTDPALLILDYRPAQGSRVSNVGSLPPVDGFATLSETEISGTGIDDSYLAQGVAIDGGRLTVAMTRAQMVDMAEGFLAVLLISLLPTLAIASSLGIVFARRARRRIDTIGATLQSLRGGDLSARVRLDPAEHDDLSVIGVAVNGMAEAQEAAMTALRQVTGDIAHDLKTPIQRVAVTLDRLESRTALSPDQQAYVDEARAETDRIAKTFDALLRIAQIEGGTLRDRFAPVDLQPLCAGIVELFGPTAEETGRRLSFNADGPCVVMGDRDLLGQVLANLIENGLRHVPGGGQIAVTLSRAGGRCTLRVADNGPGIPAEERANVLHRLYRLEASRTTPGNGLGLSMVAAICDLHSAALTLQDNTPGLVVSVTFAG
jgi:signal transduction histidine kinase